MSKITIFGALVIAALGVSVALQYQSLQQLRQQNEDLKQQVAQIAPLQEKLAQAETQPVRASPTDAQMLELARLRNEVSQLRAQTNNLVKTQQEMQTQAQRAASQLAAQQAGAGAAEARINQMQRIANIQSMNACINNLRMIDSAKQQWALENQKQNTDTPTMDDLRPYFSRGPNAVMPTCQDGGVYTIGMVGEKPTCSIPGHALP